MMSPPCYLLLYAMLLTRASPYYLHMLCCAADAADAAIFCRSAIDAAFRRYAASLLIAAALFAADVDDADALRHTLSMLATLLR